MAARHLGFAPSACLAMKDSRAGIESARQAGCVVAAITTSFDAVTLLGYGVHLAFSDYVKFGEFVRD